jgi:MFS family permease
MDKQEISAFDRVLDSKIGLGSYQLKAFISLALVDLIDGLDIISMSLILPMLVSEFSLNSFETQLLGGTFPLGMIFGSLLSGIFADGHGRKKTMICSGIL